MAKKKKEKVVYYDDNSTISDMSNVRNTFNPIIKGKNKESLRNNNYSRPKSSFKDKWTTYWSAVKMMIKPMLIVLIILAVLFLGLRLLTM